MADEYSNLDPSFAASLRALAAKLGGNLHVYSGYRTPEHQAQLYQAAIAKYGSPEAARKYVAPPGKSFHNKGEAADLRGDLAKAHSLAAQFGLNFPMGHEPWHIEPTGIRRGSMAPPRGNTRGSSPQQSITGGADSLSAAIGQSGLAPWLQRLVDAFQPPSPLGGLYDPNAPNPTSYGADQQPQTFGNSDNQLRDMAESDAAKKAAEANPNTIESKKSAALSKIFKGHSDYLAAHVPPAYEQPAEVPVPQSQFADIPGRQAPRLDPAAAVLSSIFGAIAPQFAGAFAAQPLQAGVENAQQQYQDQIRKYQQLQQQFQQRHEDELAQANEKRLYGEQGAEARYRNAIESDRLAREAEGSRVQTEQQGALASILGEAGQSQNAATEAATRAGQYQRRIDEGLRQNASRTEAFNRGTERYDKLIGNLVQGGIGFQKALETQSGENERARQARLSREKIAEDTNNRITDEGRLNRGLKTTLQNNAFENRKKFSDYVRKANAATPDGRWTQAQTTEFRAARDELLASQRRLQQVTPALASAYALLEHEPGDTLEKYIVTNTPQIQGEIKAGADKVNALVDRNNKTFGKKPGAGTREIFDPVTNTFKKVK